MLRHQLPHSGGQSIPVYKCDQYQFFRNKGLTHIANSITIRSNPSGVVETPLVTENVLKEERGCARRDAIDGVVRAHDTSDLGVSDAGLEGGSVVLAQILLADNGVERITLDSAPVLHVVPGVVLTVSDDLEVRLRINTALQAVDETVDVLGGVEGVFAWRLLPTSPTGVLERVDIGSPEIKSGTACVVESASLGTDYRRDGLNEVVIEGSTHENGLREGSGIAEISRRCESNTRGRGNTMLRCRSQLDVGLNMSVDVPELPATTGMREDRGGEYQENR